ncbi:MAG: twin-arginine translocation signal domain-containing protein, partial [Desulfobacteraceae bacterium]|nr:twin-arginine translocation signal domain-containing protein [Desulfobacteraceae bacterium]
MQVTRREFLGAASIAAGAVLAEHPDISHAARKEKELPSPEKLLKIGVLTCHPVHHHLPNAWAPMINRKPYKDGFIHTRMTGMVLSHIWDIDPERVRTFCDEFGTKPVKKYDDMVDKVDGVIISDVRNGDYFPEL